MADSPDLWSWMGRLARWIRAPRTHRYWERRYRGGGDSGTGSYDRLALFKAEVLGELARRYQIETVTEWGCGDGHQQALAEWPQYTGYDVSATAVRMCRERFVDDPTKDFRLVEDYADETADAALSLDVIFHLVEDRSFEPYIERLFRSAQRLVVIYSSNTDEDLKPSVAHVRHRKFTDWIARHRPGWILAEHIPNRFPHVPGDDRTSVADFFVFERRLPPASTTHP